MNLEAIISCIIFVCAACFLAFPFGKGYVRARWAKCIGFAIGVIGIVRGSVGLALSMNWLVLNSVLTYKVTGWVNFSEGVMMGFALSLVFSGQLLGAKTSVK
jgi:hypothetical protein